MIVRRCHCENPDVPHACPEFEAAYRDHLVQQVWIEGIRAEAATRGPERPSAWRILRMLGLALAGLIAVWLAFVYTFGGGYFPGGPMHFPGDDSSVSLLVTGAFLLVLGIGGGLWWLWDGVLSHRVTERARDRIDDVLVGAGTTLLFLYPVLALGGLIAYIALG